MDKYYSLKSDDNITVDLKNLKDEFNKSYKQRSIKSYIRENEKKLIELDKNLVKIFLFHKKSRDLFISLKIKEKDEIKIDSIEKMSITSTLEAYFYSILNRGYFIRSSCVYIFSIVFPLFPKKYSDLFFNEILNNINKIKFFQRYYIYIILKSLHKYYLVNQINGQFPELTLERIKNYCSLVKDYLINNSIIPNEEIFLFLKKVLSGDKLNNENGQEKKEEKENKKSNFVFKLDKDENYVKSIMSGEIKLKGDNKLNFTYKEETKEFNLMNDAPIILQMVYSIYDTYFNYLKFDIIKFESDSLMTIIINLIYYLISYNDNNLAKFLIASIDICKKLEEDKKIYKSNNINKENNIINENMINKIEINIIKEN
jgi:hypothetical protein